MKKTGPSNRIQTILQEFAGTANDNDKGLMNYVQSFTHYHKPHRHPSPRQHRPETSKSPQEGPPSQ
ncbi:MAG: hypothetical protein VXY77_02590 [Pseudomonadota bacterium]|nr:hypothetical protein [Pseudomonadota bacterium]